MERKKEKCNEKYKILCYILKGIPRKERKTERKERKKGEIRAVAGQRSSPDLCFATTSVKIYEP